jgi:Tfp pilus assembly protein PilX
MSRSRRSCARGHRRGIAAVVTVVLVVLINLMVVGMVLALGREQDITIRRVETVQAFYAAEGGVNMAIRELMLDTDEDGDGTIGTISDDGVPANDPSLGLARLRVTATVGGGQTTLESIGSAGVSTRRLVAVLED